MKRFLAPLLAPASLLLVVLWCGSTPVQAADTAKKVVLIAGPITGHPKEAHEYEKNVILLKHLLETSPNARGLVKVEAYFKGWPQAPGTLNDADTIVLISDGGDHREQDHPLYVGDRLEQLGKQMARGCGVLFFHWTTFHPSRVHDRITEWAGGYFDYETGPAPRKWYSAIQTWKAEARLGVPGHPISRGVQPFTQQEEFYYRIKFRDNDPRLQPILVTRPPGETTDHTVGWAVERADGGRGFGTTGGHFYANWWNADFRKLILNAILWTAKAEVPADGVISEPFERHKVLIVTGHNHPAHDWSATTAALLNVIEQDPRALVHVTENPEEIAQGKLAGYDAVVWNYVNWERAGLSAAAKENLLKYLRQGGGLALVHFANGAFHPSLPKTQPGDAWPEFYRQICRRVWDHAAATPSAHDPYGDFQVNLTPVEHPITAGLAPFTTRDELYFHQAGAAPIEVLASAVSKITKQAEPLAWTYTYEQARVFQTLLGHSDESVRKAGALIRRGVTWAAGKNPLSFDPPAALTDGALFRDGSQWKPKPVAKAAPVTTPVTAPAPPAPKAAAPPAGQHGSAGMEPGAQKESDWVDNRWSQTELGKFLASNVRTPNGVLAKGLSIKVGDGDAGAVAYDTGNGALRAAWTGGFLKFSPTRFGLIDASAIAGQVEFSAPAGPAWPGATTRFTGLHLVANQRVVLEWDVNGVRVLESPWYRPEQGGRLFIRSFEIASHDTPMKLNAAPHWPGAEVGSEVSDSGWRATWTNRNDIVVASATLPSIRKADMGDAGASLVIPPSTTPQRFDVLIWRGPKEASTGYAASSKTAPPSADIDWTLKPAPARWLPELKAAGQRGADTDILAVDTVTVPYDNPWKALMFLAGVDFTSDGTGYACTIHGDVWRVTGVDDTLKQVTWKRYATGLFQALGLKVRGDKVYVLGRDQITRLHDQNGDGEADFYENFCNLIDTSTGGHDYVTCLEQDAQGNFYYVDPRGVHRVAPDGRSKQTIATGWRNPNGMGVSPGGIITVAPQQGNWTPSSHISQVKPGGYYGYGGPKLTPERPLGYDPHLVWMPHSVDNSSGSQVWVPAGQWGPLGGALLHLLWGRSGLMLTLRDEVEGVAQGAVVPLPGRLLSGPNRGSFNPRDGQLYVAGSTGWQTSAIKDGALQRVRFTGKPVYLPTGFHVHANGLAFTFSQPLDKSTAEDAGSYGLKQWNYKYAADYGSKDWSVADPTKEGRDEVEIKSARLLPDGRTVFLEIPGLKPVMQMELRYNVDAIGKKAMRGQLWLTVNKLGSELR